MAKRRRRAPDPSTLVAAPAGRWIENAPPSSLTVAALLGGYAAGIAVAVGAIGLVHGMASRLSPGLLVVPFVVCLALVVLAPMALVSLIARRTSIRAGADGVALRTVTGERFVPYAEMDVLVREPLLDAQESRRAARLRLGDGSHVTIASADAAIEPVLDRIEAGIARAARATQTSLPPGIARDATPNDEWLARLGRLLRADEGYRESPVDRDALFAVVEDPLAAPGDRAAAAAVLSRGLRPDERARVRVAAEATASPRVRVVLEAAADDARPDVVEKALARATE